MVAAIGVLVACGSSAIAQEGDLARCLPIADVQQRVACYDAIARAQAGAEAATAPVAPAPSPAPAPPAHQAPSAAAPPVAPAGAAAQSNPRADFGLSPAAREERLPDEQRQLEEVRAVVASARIVGPGYWEFEMQDGSVWRLAETRRSFRAPRAGDAVGLRRGSLGSYFLEADGQAGIRIKRVS